MAWKCKECGEDVVAVGEVHTAFDFEINKKGDLYDVRDWDLRYNLVDDAWVSHYRCDGCYEESEELEELAEWEDE